MNIVVLDSDRLAGEADFPEVDCPKYGWLQYTATTPDQLEERCWRSDIIISVATEINRELIDKAYKLKLIVLAGEDFDHVDTAAANERGIKVCHVPGLNPDIKSDTDRICQQVIENINAFLRGEDLNLVGMHD